MVVAGDQNWNKWRAPRVEKAPPKQESASGGRYWDKPNTGTITVGDNVPHRDPKTNIPIPPPNVAAEFESEARKWADWAKHASEKSGDLIGGSNDMYYAGDATTDKKPFDPRDYASLFIDEIPESKPVELPDNLVHTGAVKSGEKNFDPNANPHMIEGEANSPFDPNTDLDPYWNNMVKLPSGYPRASDPIDVKPNTFIKLPDPLDELVLILYAYVLPGKKNYCALNFKDKDGSSDHSIHISFRTLHGKIHFAQKKNNRWTGNGGTTPFNLNETFTPGPDLMHLVIRYDKIGKHYHFYFLNDKGGPPKQYIMNTDSPCKYMCFQVEKPGDVPLEELQVRYAPYV